MTSRHRILVVEDDTEIREALLEILEENGCDPVGVSNGKRALDLLRSANDLPCLIVLDLMMPVMDGATFREEQLQDPVLSKIPVVVVSAYRDVQTHAAKLQAAQVLNKPLKIDDLVSAITEHC